MSERGIFDGEGNSTTIFDPNIFDTLLVEPVPANEIDVFVHGNDNVIDMFWHGNEIIPRSIS